MTETRKGFELGRKIAPPRFIAFVLIAAIAIPGAIALSDWRQGVMGGFDIAALVFLVSLIPLADDKSESMRRAACRNDANRAVLLGITGVVSLVVLVAVAAELNGKDAKQPLSIALIVATLALAWLFSNTVYALHYAHIFYSSGDDGKDCGGIDVPGTDEPDYWDFIYFSFTLGMTFQTADVDMTGARVRRIAIMHCLAAFVFNLGVLAFTINVLGGS